MAEANTQTQAQDAAASGAVDVAAITKSVTEAVTKQVSESITPKLSEMESNINTVATTLAKLPPAQAEVKKEESVGLTQESVNKLIDDTLTARQKASEESAARNAERQKLIEDVTRNKLGGDSKLASRLVGNTKEELEADAESLAATIKNYKPDFGGAAQNGGQTVGAGTQKSGESWVKLPK